MRAASQHRVNFAQIHVRRCLHAVAQQRIDAHAERVCDVHDGRQAQLRRTALNVRNVGRLLIGQLGQSLLRQPPLLPVPADADADRCIIEFQFVSLPENFSILLLYIRFGYGKML